MKIKFNGHSPTDREDISIEKKDLAIGLARAILEAYGVG